MIARQSLSIGWVTMLISSRAAAYILHIWCCSSCWVTTQLRGKGMWNSTWRAYKWSVMSCHSRTAYTSTSSSPPPASQPSAFDGTVLHGGCTTIAGDLTIIVWCDDQRKLTQHRLIMRQRVIFDSILNDRHQLNDGGGGGVNESRNGILRRTTGSW